MEIERKYLVKEIPVNLDQYESKKIAQGYLCTEPVVRIRRSNNDYYMTYKGDGLTVREEYNLPLTEEAYTHLRSKIDGLLIAKTRYLIPLNDKLTAELDIFEEDLKGLVIVEVEFDSVEEANAFSAPDWFGEDVTNSGKYHNSYLSQHGLAWITIRALPLFFHSILNACILTQPVCKFVLLSCTDGVLEILETLLDRSLWNHSIHNNSHRIDHAVRDIICHRHKNVVSLLEAFCLKKLHQFRADLWLLCHTRVIGWLLRKLTSLTL